MKSNADPGVKKVLLINKSDIPQKAFQYEEALQWARSEQIDVYETSAKTGKNVNQVFTDLCRHLMTVNPSREMNKLHELGNPLSTRDVQNQPQESGCCGGN